MMNSEEPVKASPRYKMINPTKYVITIVNAEKQDALYFLESYDPNWIARINKSGEEVKSEDLDWNNINIFYLPKEGTYEVEVYYKPQKLVNTGLVVSGTTFTVLLAVLLKGPIYTVLKKKKKRSQVS